MTLPLVLAIAGCVALLVGLFGGGVKAKEIEVPKISFISRVFSALVGLALIGLSLWFPYMNLPLPSIITPTITPSPIASPIPPVTNIPADDSLSTVTTPTQIVPVTSLKATQTFTAKKVIGNIMEKDIWFTKPYRIFPNYVLEINYEPTGDDFERLVSYFRLYRHPQDCESKYVRGVSIQVIFFNSDNGSRQYFTDSKKTGNLYEKITDSVGETSLFRKSSQTDDHCTKESVDRYLLLFQRYNAIGLVSAWIVPDSISYNNMEDWLNQIGSELDASLIENAN